MNNIPLTAEQSAFAAENHDIIKTFLRFKNLSYDEYYDTVIFGYLEAVRTYCERPDLRSKYPFKTIAFRVMSFDLLDYYRAKRTKKRKAYTVSLNSFRATEDGELSMSELVGESDTFVSDIETGFLWDEIKSILSGGQLGIIRMRMNGYNDREIAKHYNIPMQTLESISGNIRMRCKDVCAV